MVCVVGETFAVGKSLLHAPRSKKSHVVGRGTFWRTPAPRSSYSANINDPTHITTKSIDITTVSARRFHPSMAGRFYSWTACLLATTVGFTFQQEPDWRTPRPTQMASPNPHESPLHQREGSRQSLLATTKPEPTLKSAPIESMRILYKLGKRRISCIGL